MSLSVKQEYKSETRRRSSVMISEEHHIEDGKVSSRRSSTVKVLFNVRSEVTSIKSYLFVPSLQIVFMHVPQIPAFPHVSL